MIEKKLDCKQVFIFKKNSLVLGLALKEDIDSGLVSNCSESLNPSPFVSRTSCLPLTLSLAIGQPGSGGDDRGRLMCGPYSAYAKQAFLPRMLRMELRSRAWWSSVLSMG